MLISVSDNPVLSSTDFVFFLSKLSDNAAAIYKTLFIDNACIKRPNN